MRNQDSAKNIINDQVFNQSCEVYLHHCGIQVADGCRIDCPYRDTSDSGDFVVNGCMWFDHPRQEGGNVYELALKMHHGDKFEAIKSLYESVGVPFEEYEAVEKKLSDREKAYRALERVQAEYGIGDFTPDDVMGYLKSRGITEKTYRYLAYVPAGGMEKILTEEEIKLTGLRDREEQVILWYFRRGKPVYYCTRKIGEKAFKKAYTGNGVLEHPIWNIDALYKDEVVIWGEGMFDCLSLIEMGYGCCGEITCYLAKNHEPELLRALRWRNRNHPDWDFLICLDNDELTSDGRRPGNDAAEKIATWLFGNAIDVRWVKHNPANTKVDINDLHVNGFKDQIQSMFSNTPFTSEILEPDPEMCCHNFIRMQSSYDYRGAVRMAEVMAEQDDNAPVKDMVKYAQTQLWDWRHVYTDDIQEIFEYDSDVYVLFRSGTFDSGERHYDVFSRSTVISNLRRYQRNRSMKVKFANLDVLYKRPTWRVSKELNLKDGATYNLFEPSRYLRQKPRENVVLPVMWSKVLDNLAGDAEKEWLLNHMAVYVQTLEKPRTIPILLGVPGTGKTKTAELFGKGVGGFMSVGITEVESTFNNYLLNPVVLLDELASNTGEANKMKNKLKGFINENVTVNNKFEKVYTVNVNNYIFIASNEQTTFVPVQIESNDRRYTVISGGRDKNLAHEDWFDYKRWESELGDFMLYLLSRDIDVKMAQTPLMNDKRNELMQLGEDFRISYVSEYLDEVRRVALDVGDRTMKVSEVCSGVNERHKLRYEFTGKSMTPILKHLGYEVFKKNHQGCIRIEPLVSESAVSAAAVTGSETLTTTTTTCTDSMDWIMSDNER